MRLAVFTGLAAISSFFWQPAVAHAAEQSVCVDVVVQRSVAKKKPAESPAPALATPAPSTAAPGPTIQAGAAPAVTPPVSAPGADESSASEMARKRRERASEVVNMDAVVDLDPDGSRDPRVMSGAHLPLGQTPETYLKRLMEHFVTHERGFIAVSQGCKQRIIVDLYPLRLGWTAFARYSGTGREERVDQLLPTELSQFAERSVLALLRDVAISDTVDRNNVLWADSLKATQSIRGRGHVVLGLGTRLRGGTFDSVVTDESSASVGQVEQRFRLLTPMVMMVGYRGQFEEFGVEAAGELDIGTSQTAARRNPTGGHIDYGGSAGIVLHAVRYSNVRGLTSFYYGGGATFALHWFSAIRPAEDTDSRSTLWSGGLDVDGVLGYEFMRASAISFFLQGELNVPAYAVRNENNSGAINTWFPGAALKLGAVF
jgi:hypothetical protein